MSDTPTIGELYKLKQIADEELDAAVADYLNDPKPGIRLIANGIVLDLAAAVARHEWANRIATNPAMGEGARRNAVRTAILLARPA